MTDHAFAGGVSATDDEFAEAWCTCGAFAMGRTVAEAERLLTCLATEETPEGQLGGSQNETSDQTGTEMTFPIVIQLPPAAQPSWAARRTRPEPEGRPGAAADWGVAYHNELDVQGFDDFATTVLISQAVAFGTDCVTINAPAIRVLGLQDHMDYYEGLTAPQARQLSLALAEAAERLDRIEQDGVGA